MTRLARLNGQPRPVHVTDDARARRRVADDQLEQLRVRAVEPPLVGDERRAAARTAPRAGRSSRRWRCRGSRTRPGRIARVGVVAVERAPGSRRRRGRGCGRPGRRSPRRPRSRGFGRAGEDVGAASLQSTAVLKPSRSASVPRSHSAMMSMKSLSTSSSPSPQEMRSGSPSRDWMVSSPVSPKYSSMPAPPLSVSTPGAAGEHVAALPPVSSSSPAPPAMASGTVTPSELSLSFPSLRSTKMPRADGAGHGPDAGPAAVAGRGRQLDPARAGDQDAPVAVCVSVTSSWFASPVSLIAVSRGLNAPTPASLYTTSTRRPPRGR